jgi:hypothetical protein
MKGVAQAENENASSANVVVNGWLLLSKMITVRTEK